MRYSIAIVAALLVSAFCSVAAAESGSGKPAKSCTNMSRKCLIAIARTYLDARTDYRLKPFQRVAPNVHRWENGVMTADSAGDIVGPAGADASQTLFPRDLDRTLVDGDQAVFFWRMDKKDSPTGPFTSTVHLIERFKFGQGKRVCGDALSPCITEIEVVFCIAPHPMEPGEAAPPKGAHPVSYFLCNRGG